MYELKFAKQCTKDFEKLKNSPYLKKAKTILEDIAENPYNMPYEKLVGDKSGLYSKRINIQHRIVYEVFEETKQVVVYSMWSHYDYI